MLEREKVPVQFLVGLESEREKNENNNNSMDNDDMTRES